MITNCFVPKWFSLRKKNKVIIINHKRNIGLHTYNKNAFKNCHFFFNQLF